MELVDRGVLVRRLREAATPTSSGSPFRGWFGDLRDVGIDLLEASPVVSECVQHVVSGDTVLADAHRIRRMLDRVNVCHVALIGDYSVDRDRRSTVRSGIPALATSPTNAIGM